MKSYYWVFDKKRKLIGLVEADNINQAIKKLKGQFALDCLGKWVIYITYYLTKGVIIHEK